MPYRSQSSETDMGAVLSERRQVDQVDMLAMTGIENNPPTQNIVASCVASLREMLVNGVLLPGEQIRQDEMARRLKASRVPLREALRVLETEKILIHKPNQGYFVARLDQDELSEVYLMRKVLETVLLESMEWPTEPAMELIVGHNIAMERAIVEENLREIIACNFAFHFGVFALSPLMFIRQEVRRLWSLSDAYRSVYLYDRGAREAVLADHAELIEALRARDQEALVGICDRHRLGLQRYLAGLIEGTGAMSATGAAGAEWRRTR